MDIKRTFDFAEYALQNHPMNNCLTVKRNGKWDIFSTDEFVKNSYRCSYGLMELGIKPGDKIATVSNNRPEWNFADTGMSMAGIVHVPVYPTIGSEEYEHVLKHSEAKILILSSEERYNFIKDIAKKVGINKIYTFDKVEGVPNFNEILELGKQNESKHYEGLKKIKSEIKEDDLCSIIYTSGTTGLSKGVMISHKNFVSNVLDSKVAVPKNAKKALSFLPLNHVFERIITYIYMYSGISINYAESTDTIGENLLEIKPHIIAAVPRVIEKLYEKIYSKGLALKGIKRNLFFWALNLGMKYQPDKKQGFLYNQQLALANKVIFNKWREALGGEIIAMVSGSAALQPRLSRVFCAAQIPILEGYGLTETSPVISVNRLDEIIPGTVGRLLDSAEVKIGERDEILFKGPNLMMGYYNDEEKTKEVIDENGWFHTGDTGKLEGRILSITGRIKELFKLSTGKYVAPQLIENKMKESPFIDQLMVVGEGEKFCAAVICPSFEFLHDWASEHKIHFKDNLELITNETVKNRIQREVDKHNEPLDKTMKIKKFSLVCEQWSPETGELSPTLKPKRRIIKEKYKVKLDFLYGYSKDEGHIVK